MLLHFSFPNINKRACRVLKWLAIETIDEQLFLHEARTGQFQTENIHFRFNLPIPFAFAPKCLSLTLCIKIKTVHSDLSSFPAWQSRWIYSHRQWLAVLFVKAALRQATARAQLRKTVKYTKIRPDSLLQSFETKSTTFVLVDKYVFLFIKAFVSLESSFKPEGVCIALLHGEPICLLAPQRSHFNEWRTAAQGRAYTSHYIYQPLYACKQAVMQFKPRTVIGFKIKY